MYLIPVIALAIGVILGVAIVGPAPGIWGTYLALACLAGIDSLLGGIRTAMEQRFHADVLVTGFVANTLIAFGLGFLGDQIGLDLFLVAALVLGSRIFQNLSLIRRLLLTRYQDAKARKRLQQQQEIPRDL